MNINVRKNEKTFDFNDESLRLRRIKIIKQSGQVSGCVFSHAQACKVKTITLRSQNQ